MLSSELTHELEIILKEEFELDLSSEQAQSIGGFLLQYAETLISINKNINIKEIYGKQKNVK